MNGAIHTYRSINRLLGASVDPAIAVRWASRVTSDSAAGDHREDPLAESENGEDVLRDRAATSI